MWIVALILLASSVALYWSHREQKSKHAWITETKLYTVEHLRELADSMREGLGRGSLRFPATVRGVVRCGEPLTSELAEVPCVHYEMQVKRRYEETRWETDSEGNRRQRTVRGSETVAGNERSVAFELEGATGKVEVQPSEDAEWITEKTLSRFEPERGVGGSVGRFRFDAGFNRGGRRTLGYQLEEKAIPVGREIWVLGEVTEDLDGDLRVVTPQDEDGHLILSVKSRQELLKSTGGLAKTLYVLAILAGVIGVALLLAGLLSP